MLKHIPSIIGPDLLKTLMEMGHGDEIAIVMEVPKNNFVETPIWKEFDSICRAGDEAYKNYSLIEAGEFYNRTESCYAIIATGEKALYANIILRKGIVR